MASGAGGDRVPGGWRRRSAVTSGRVDADQQTDHGHDTGGRADDRQQPPDVGQPMGLVAELVEPIGDRRVLVQRDRRAPRRSVGSGRRGRSARSCRPRCRRAARRSGPRDCPPAACRRSASARARSEDPAPAASSVIFTPRTVRGGRTAPATEVRQSSAVDRRSARKPVEIHSPMMRSVRRSPVIGRAPRPRRTGLACRRNRSLVATAGRHQLVVVALLDDPTVGQHADRRHRAYHGQPVRDHQRGDPGRTAPGSCRPGCASAMTSSAAAGSSSTSSPAPASTARTARASPRRCHSPPERSVPPGMVLSSGVRPAGGQRADQVDDRRLRSATASSRSVGGQLGMSIRPAQVHPVPISTLSPAGSGSRTKSWVIGAIRRCQARSSSSSRSASADAVDQHPPRVGR